MQKLWMAVSADIWEIPLCIGKTGMEIAEKMKLAVNSIYDQKRRASKGRRLGMRIITVTGEANPMKYEILGKFKEYLREQVSPNTAKKYYSAVCGLLTMQQFDSLSEIDRGELEAGLLRLPTKNELSAAKNGLKHLADFDSEFSLPSDDFFKTAAGRKKNIIKSRGKEVHWDTVNRKINQMSNLKLKVAYRLMQISGLRVSEVADLDPKDITFLKNGALNIHVKCGKGGKEGDVTTMVDSYVFLSMKRLCENTPVQEKLFYAAPYIENQAGALGMECHDLRRIYAKRHKQFLMQQEGMTADEAEAVVQTNLRHESRKTTQIYLTERRLLP